MKDKQRHTDAEASLVAWAVAITIVTALLIIGSFATVLAVTH